MISELLGRRATAVTTEQVLFRCPEGFVSQIGSIVICNPTAGTVTVRLSLSPGGGVTDAAAYLMYDHPIPAYDTVEWSPNVTIGLTSQDEFRVYASAADIAFNCFGVKEPVA